MTNKKYILDDERNLVEVDLLTWGAWFEHTRKERIVAKDTVGDKDVSTVFIGIDYNFGEGEPHLFETMIFPEAEVFERYPTWDRAVEGHMRAVASLTPLDNTP